MLLLGPKPRLLLLLLAAPALASALGCQVASAETQVQVTRNEQAQWHRDFFSAHTVSLERFDDGVRLVSDGSFRIEGADDAGLLLGIEGGPLLREKDVFLGPPDEHSSTTYTVLRVGDKSVEIGYVAEFDHRAFGRDLITRDDGTVMLPYFSNSTQKPSQNGP